MVFAYLDGVEINALDRHPMTRQDYLEMLNKEIEEIDKYML